MEVRVGDRVMVMCKCRTLGRDCLLGKGKKREGFKGCNQGVVMAWGQLERFCIVRMGS